MPTRNAQQNIAINTWTSLNNVFVDSKAVHYKASKDQTHWTRHASPHNALREQEAKKPPAQINLV